MSAEPETVENCLRHLGVDETPRHIETLDDGDGEVFRVSLPARVCLLRHTPSSAPPHLQERARREIQFHAKLAALIPLSVPRLLGSYADEDGLCAMWAAGEPAKPARVWVEQDFFDAASDLAALHAGWWGRAGRLADHVFLRRPMPHALEQDILAAFAAWRELAAREPNAAVLTGQMMGQLRALLLNFAAIEKALRATPATLVHGDCAPRRLFRGGAGQWVWWGWSMVGIGRAAQDVSALLQNAQNDGATPPTQKILAHYQARVKTVLGDEFPMVAFLRAMDAAELQARLLRAPYALARAGAQEVADVTHRITQLARKLTIQI